MVNGFQAAPMVNINALPQLEEQRHRDVIDNLPLHIDDKILLFVDNISNITSILKFIIDFKNLHEDERNIPGIKEIIHDNFNKELLNRRIHITQNILNEIAIDCQQNPEYEEAIEIIFKPTKLLDNIRQYVALRFDGNEEGA